MSDYGALITLRKKDRTAVSAKEKEIINAELAEVQTLGEFTDVKGEEFLFELNDTEETYSITIVLSQYSYKGLDFQKDLEAAEENDLGHAEEVAALLELPLGEIFEIYPAFENW